MAKVAQLDRVDDDPYRLARETYNDRYADLGAGKRNWQFAALGFFLVAVMTSAIGIIQVRQVKQIPYVVAVDRSDGYAFTIPLPMSSSNTSIDLRTIEQNEVAAFIRHARTIDADTVGEDALLRDVKAHVRGQADRFLADYYTDYAHRPYLVARDHSTLVTIASLIGVGLHSWQCRWTETRFDRQGHTLRGEGPERWVALIHTVVEPQDGNALTNPAGVFIDVIQWTREDLPGEEGQH
jgi:type IV secretory pathway TrbF-like protein